MAVIITAKTIGVDKVIKRFTESGARAAELYPALVEVQGVLEKSTLDHFMHGISPENAPSTIAAKGDKPVGVDYGDLEKSLTEPHDPNAVRNIGPGFLEYGTSLWYSHFFAGTSHQPPRELADVTPGDLEEMEWIISNYIVNGTLTGVRR